MAEWSREKVESPDLNKGQEWTKNDQVALEELNAMVNSGLYAQDFVEKLVENIDVSEIGNVGTPTVELIDGDGATTEKPYKKFKFSNFKGDKGDFGADYDSLSNKPIINADVSTLSVSSVVVNQIYRHTGTSTETLIKNKLYFSNGTEWVVYGDDGNSKVNFVDSLTTTTNLPQLNMNRLTEQELTDAKDKGTINANELYMTEDATEDDPKANIDASNLSDENVESWKSALGTRKKIIDITLSSATTSIPITLGTNRGLFEYYISIPYLDETGVADVTLNLSSVGKIVVNGTVTYRDGETFIGKKYGYGTVMSGTFFLKNLYQIEASSFGYHSQADSYCVTRARIYSALDEQGNFTIKSTTNFPKNTNITIFYTPVD